MGLGRIKNKKHKKMNLDADQIKLATLTWLSERPMAERVEACFMLLAANWAEKRSLGGYLLITGGALLSGIGAVKVGEMVYVWLT